MGAGGGDSCEVESRQGLFLRGLLSYYGAMRFLLQLSSAVIFLSSPVFGEEKPGTVDFLEDVLPVLAGKCFPCHGPDKAKRKSGLRLDTAEGIFSTRKSGRRVGKPGDAGSSLLIERVETADPDELMPPADSELVLSPEEAGVLRSWVESGARWKEHWAYKAPERPALPEVKDPGWVRNPIDAFVLSRLEKANLAPAPAASSTTLLRRLWLDLTGVPPGPAELQRSLEDSNPGSWEKVVDRLLASPHFGERSAQDWLDAARYADTTGYAADKPREMWVYREWVIDAFNFDMPFDQFTVEQLAGDMLPGATTSQKIATGFHRNSMQAKGNNPRKEEFRVKGVVDRVNTTGRVWLGISLECAECHTHKYDPISQRDYYRVYALFNNIPHLGEGYGVHGPRLKVPPPRQQEELASLERRRSELLKWQALRAEQLAGGEFTPEEISRLLAGAPGALASWRLSGDLAPQRVKAGGLLPSGGVPEWVEGPPALGKGAARFNGKNSLLAENNPQFDLTGSFTISAWVRTKSAVADIVSKYDWLSGQRSFVFGIGGEGDKNGTPGHLFGWVSATAAAWNGAQIHSSFAVNDGQWHHLAFVFDAGKSMKLFIDGKQDLEAKLVGKAPGKVASSSRRIAIGAGYTKSEVPDEFFIKGDLADLRLYSRALADMDTVLSPSTGIRAAVEKNPSLRNEKERALVRDFALEADPGLQDAREELAGIDRRKKELSGRQVTVPVMVELKEPRKTHILIRGDFRDKGDEVEPGLPDLFSTDRAAEPRDRLGFARWLINGKNPLVARVTVNRIWQRYFGRGLVGTTGDFGLRGEVPSHPKLLDWLAEELVDSGWDLKVIHRLIVSSETYRQSSVATLEQRSADPFNRFLARAGRSRLPAEQIRDLSLAAGGLLDQRIGGASVFPVQPGNYWGEKGQEKDSGKWVTSRGRDLYRRGLYTYWKRMALYPSFWILDAPTRQVCTMSRAVTNTPVQALVTLNDPVFFEASRGFAVRVLKEAAPGVKERLRHAFLVALSRFPLEQEEAAFASLLSSLSKHYRADPAAAARVHPGAAGLAAGAELAAWTVLSSTLLNLDEAITRE